MKKIYKLTHVINGMKSIHIETLNYKDINKAYKHFKNTFGNTTFICLEIIKD
jgi:hypothetical protein